VFSPPVRPRLRGVSHTYAFFAAVLGGAVLVVLAPSGRAAFAGVVYATSLAGLFGISTLYHRVTWRPRARSLMRRLDHSMIFVFIAGTYTPFALLVFTGALGTAILVVAWTGAIGGIVLSVAWPGAPRVVKAAVYLSLGWISVVAVPQLLAHAGVGAVILIAAGGALYSAGAVVYALRRPDPLPATFGYHEVFHALVIGAAGAHFAAVAAYAVPG
jgi:hemolysin III